jgi:hypothetical protein
MIMENFDTALNEMKLALAAAPEPLETSHADLIRRLQYHEDINK